MSSYFNCAAYSDMETTIRLSDNVVFLALADKEKNTTVHLTLNPFQARALAKYLSLALTKIDFKSLEDEKHFGDLTVHIEQNNSSFDFYDKIYDDSEYDLAVPC